MIWTSEKRPATWPCHRDSVAHTRGDAWGFRSYTLCCSRTDKGRGLLFCFGFQFLVFLQNILNLLVDVFVIVNAALVPSCICCLWPTGSRKDTSRFFVALLSLPEVWPSLRAHLAIAALFCILSWAFQLLRAKTHGESCLKRKICLWGCCKA